MGDSQVPTPGRGSASGESPDISPDITQKYQEYSGESPDISTDIAHGVGSQSGESYINTDTSVKSVGSKAPGDISTEFRCIRCGKVWPKDAIGRKCAATGVCIDRRYCRARQLTDLIDIKLFGRVPREHWQAWMDVRPENWKAIGWEPAHSEIERVDACIKFYSWCFPVCMPYACRINSDDSDVVYDPHVDGPVPLGMREMARILGMHQPNVVRAVKGLIARNKVRVEDGRIYPVAAPEALTIEQRRALDAPELGAMRDPESLRWIPGKFRAEVAAALEGLNGSGAAALSELMQIRDAFNKALESIRSDRNLAIEKWTGQNSIILCRDREDRLLLPGASSAAGNSTTENRPLETVRVANVLTQPAASSDTSLEAAYAAGLGKGALAKLPAHEERAALVELGEAVAHYVGQTDEHFLRSLLGKVGAIAPDATVQDIIDVIHQKGHFSRGVKPNAAGHLWKSVLNAFKSEGESLHTRLARDRGPAAAAAPDPPAQATEICNWCSGYGLQGAVWSNLGEARAALDQGAMICDCADGDFIRQSFPEVAAVRDVATIARDLEVSPAVARDFLERCRGAAPDARMQEIRRTIEECRPLARGAVSPADVITRAVQVKLAARRAPADPPVCPVCQRPLDDGDHEACKRSQVRAS